MKFNLAKWCLERKELVYFFVFLIAVTGIYSFQTMGRNEDPDFVVRQMVVSAAWPGASAKEVQEHVTSKLEKIVMNTPDIDYITSYSRPGRCVINVILKEQVPNATVRNHWLEVRNYIQDNASQLPSGVHGPYYNDHFDDVYGNIYALTGQDYSYEELRKTADSMKRRFFQVKDVSKVELLGEQAEKIYIRAQNAKLAKLGISVDTLSSAISAETSMLPSGQAEIDGSNIYLRLSGLAGSVEHIRNVLIKANGQTLRLGDIAEVTKEFPDPPATLMYFNGQPCIGIAISMEKGGNNIKLGENLDKLVTKLRSEIPLGMELSQVANQPQVVKNSIDEFMEGLYEAIIIVLAVSLLTLGRRSGYVISACIPLVLLGAIAGTKILGIDLHKVSLGTLIISLGMLVDDAIVVVELIEVKINDGWEKTKAATYAFETCGMPLLFGTMITCISFMPIAFSNCNVSEFAGSLFPVITVTLMFSWLVAATVAPTLAHSWLRREVNEQATYDSVFYQRFRTALTWSLGHRKLVIGGALACLVASCFTLKLVRQEFFPQSVRPELVVDLNLPEGSGIKESQLAALKLTNQLKTDSDVDHISTYVGKSAPRFVLVMNQVQPRDNFAELIVVAKDLDARNRLEEKINTMVRTKLPDVIGFCTTIPLGPPTPYPVMFRVSAPTESAAKEYASKVREKLAANPNVTVTIYDWMQQTENISIAIDNDKLKQLGISRMTVAATLQAEISGYTLAQYYEGDRNTDIVFQLNKDDRKSIDDLEKLSIPTASGMVPLAQLGRISYGSEDNMIWRRNMQPTVTVNADIGSGVTGNDVTKQVWDAMAELRANLPKGVSIEIDGPAEKSAKTLGYILDPIPLMLVSMLVLLMLQMQDLRKLVVVFCTAPLCIVGVALGLLLFDAPMGVMAQLGAFALIGTVIRNSMVIIDQVDQHMAAGMDRRTAVIESAIVRYRPIMLAALTTILGLIPMFINPFWKSMAIAMSGGLTIATVLTLIVLPVLYAVIFRVKEP